MKIAFPTIILLAGLLIWGCAGGEKSDTQNADGTEQNIDVTTPQTMNPGGTSVTGNTSDLFHYICPNNCEGSGGQSAGTCPVCGTEYVHNTAYHQQSSGTTPNNAIDIGEVQTQNQPMQNASGVSDYVCSKEGCDGAGAQAGNCPKCGSPLEHNAAFHQ